MDLIITSFGSVRYLPDMQSLPYSEANQIGLFSVHSIINSCSPLINLCSNLLDFKLHLYGKVVFLSGEVYKPESARCVKTIKGSTCRLGLRRKCTATSKFGLLVFSVLESVDYF